MLCRERDEVEVGDGTWEPVALFGVVERASIQLRRTLNRRANTSVAQRERGGEAARGGWVPLSARAQAHLIGQRFTYMRAACVRGVQRSFANGRAGRKKNLDGLLRGGAIR